MKRWFGLWIVVGSMLCSMHAWGASPKDGEWKSQPDSFWKGRLSKQQFKVCRRSGTERAWSGEFNAWKKTGIFTCSSCGLELFDSKSKFDSGTGWPSFYEPITGEAMTEHDDFGLFLSKRTELKCARCGAHLGHVFTDGPKPTGLRYCINSICLEFKNAKNNKQDKEDKEEPADKESVEAK